jgi:hypothetical protein
MTNFRYLLVATALLVNAQVSAFEFPNPFASNKKIKLPALKLLSPIPAQVRSSFIALPWQYIV